VFILKELKVVCFDTLLQVFILKAVRGSHWSLRGLVISFALREIPAVSDRLQVNEQKEGGRRKPPHRPDFVD